MATKVYVSKFTSEEIDKALSKAEVSVLTINGNKPDENGNIEITGGTGNVDEIDSITNEEIDQMFGVINYGYQKIFRSYRRSASQG